jgi:hypothetical protein
MLRMRSPPPGTSHAKVPMERILAEKCFGPTWYLYHTSDALLFTLCAGASKHRINACASKGEEVRTAVSHFPRRNAHLHTHASNCGCIEDLDVNRGMILGWQRIHCSIAADYPLCVSESPNHLSFQVVLIKIPSESGLTEMDWQFAIWEPRGNFLRAGRAASASAATESSPASLARSRCSVR